MFISRARLDGSSRLDASFDTSRRPPAARGTPSEADRRDIAVARGSLLRFGGEDARDAVARGCDGEDVQDAVARGSHAVVCDLRSSSPALNSWAAAGPQRLAR